jgi:copper homeostasis protein
VSATLEICVDDAAGVVAAVAEGADRIELCSCLELGGLTPSAALIEHAVKSGVPVHMMIRPRAGGFVLSEDEVAIMIEEIRVGVERGVSGVVIGALKADGRLDRDALARFRDAARDVAIVFHRAIDLLADPVAAVPALASLGYDKILSSGGAATASEGAPTLAAMVKAASDRLSIIAGAGVRPENVATLIAQTGVREVHGSASILQPMPDADILRFGFATGPRRRTDADAVRRLKAAIDQGRHE